MNRMQSLCTLALLTAAAAAQANPPLTMPPASRIVGTWANAAAVGPCGGNPGEIQRQTIVFNAGGTFLDIPRFPPGGIVIGGAVHTRSAGVGNWSYNPTSGEYGLEQRFDWYVDNTYHGYQVVRRTILLGNDGNTLSGPVHTERFLANGVRIAELCGTATSTRM